jgi:tetratricopeptide (TPR) repeat protein
MATKKASTRKKTKPAEVHAFTKKPKGSAVEDSTPKGTLPWEIDPKKIEESLLNLKSQVVKFANKGRYTKVRFKFRGKQLLPDLPLAAVAAVEGVTFYWAGLLRMLVFNLAGRAVIEIELVNDSEKKLQSGKEALLSGDLDAALERFREAEEMDSDNPNVHLNLGVALKLKGDVGGARAALERAVKLDKVGAVGAEATRLLNTLPQQASFTTVNPA